MLRTSGRNTMLAKELKRELNQFKSLSAPNKIKAFEELYEDYHYAMEKVKNLETLAYKEKSRSTTHVVSTQVTKKPMINSKAIRTKMHSSVATTMMILLGYVPWYLYLDPQTISAWEPMVTSVEFIAGITTVFTWVIAELDYLIRK